MNLEVPHVRMRLIAPLLLALAAVAGFIVYGALPGAGDTGSARSGVAGGGQSSPSASAPDDASGQPDGAAATNGAQPAFQVTKLQPGEQPPQFVVVSFDGACKDELFQHYMQLADRTGSHFTFFLSGLCLLPETDRFAYKPPRKPAGTSAIGFAEPSFVPQRIVNFSEAYNKGHEIGTHFLGHFCDAKGVGSWNSADWRSEMTQFNDFLDNWAKYNKVSNPTTTLPFNSSVIQGDRTPCLDGKRAAMYPVFKEFGFTYDASNPGALQWPKKLDPYGLWEFPLQRIKIAGYNKSNLSMDYNLLFVQNKGNVKADQATCDRIRKSAYTSFMDALDAVHSGNRAPFFVGNHFNTWVCGAYKDALTSFVEDAHTKYPDVQFITNADLVKWLEAQDPAVLKSLRAKGVQAY